MNEGILELADKAIEDMPGAWNIPDEFCKKFAELIVRECIGCADTVGKNNLASDYPNSTAHHVKQKIKEHFGVNDATD